MALVQKLTLDPKHEKPDPTELDKVREEYRQQLASQSQQKQQVQALVELEQEAPQNLFELGEDGDDQESDQVQPPQQQQHDQQPNQEPAGTELSEAVIEKLEMLQRYEARFPGEKTNGDLDSNHSTTSNPGKGKKGRKERVRKVDTNDSVNNGLRTVVLYPQRGTLSPAATC